MQTKKGENYKQMSPVEVEALRDDLKEKTKGWEEELQKILLEEKKTPINWNDYKYFSSSENWGEPDKMSPILLFLLDRAREAIGKPFIIHCGYELDGHAPNSYHRDGRAVDFHVKGIGLYTIWEHLNKMWWMGGLGIYPHWNNAGFHSDVGPCRRWTRDARGKYLDATGE